jgi:hypothetical protein
VEKYRRAGQATDDNMEQAHCILDTEGYTHVTRVCNTHCFSTATNVEKMRLNVTLICKLPVLNVLTTALHSSSCVDTGYIKRMWSQGSSDTCSILTSSWFGYARYKKFYSWLHDFINKD